MDIAKDGLSLVQVPQNLRQKVLTERRKVSQTFGSYLSIATVVVYLYRLQKLLVNKSKSLPNTSMKKITFYPVTNMIFKQSSTQLNVYF